MREATPEELKSVNDYIKSISYNPIVKELEKIKSEIRERANDCKDYQTYINGLMYTYSIIDNHIKELKGENNA